MDSAEKEILGDPVIVSPAPLALIEMLNIKDKSERGKAVPAAD